MDYGKRNQKMGALGVRVIGKEQEEFPRLEMLSLLFQVLVAWVYSQVMEFNAMIYAFY